MLDREEKKMYNTGIRQPKHAGGGAGKGGGERGREYCISHSIAYCINSKN